MCCLDKEKCGCKRELDQGDQVLNEIVKLAKGIGLDVVTLEQAQRNQLQTVNDCGCNEKPTNSNVRKIKIF